LFDTTTITATSVASPTLMIVVQDVTRVLTSRIYLPIVMQ
jgi:hypothetical protein